MPPSSPRHGAGSNRTRSITTRHLIRLLWSAAPSCSGTAASVSPSSPRSGPATRLHEPRFRKLSAKVGAQYIVHLPRDVGNDLYSGLADSLCQRTGDRSAQHHLHSKMPDSSRLPREGFITERDLPAQYFSLAIHLYDQQRSCEIERGRNPLVPHWNSNYGLHSFLFRRTRASTMPSLRFMRKSFADKHMRVHRRLSTTRA